MVNPDGVVLGNDVTSLSGVDLNRKWGDPSNTGTPEVYAVKEFVRAVAKQKEIIQFIDLQASSKKNNIYLYGCLDPKKAKNLPEIYKSQLFVKILSEHSKFLDLTSCKFGYKITKKRLSARVVFHEQFHILNSTTIFISHNGFENGRDVDEFLPSSFINFGKDICYSILDSVLHLADIHNEEDLIEADRNFTDVLNALNTINIDNSLKNKIKDRLKNKLFRGPSLEILSRELLKVGVRRVSNLNNDEKIDESKKIIKRRMTIGNDFKLEKEGLVDANLLQKVIDKQNPRKRMTLALVPVKQKFENEIVVVNEEELFNKIFKFNTEIEKFTKKKKIWKEYFSHEEVEKFKEDLIKKELPQDSSDESFENHNINEKKSPKINEKLDFSSDGEENQIIEKKSSIGDLEEILSPMSEGNPDNKETLETQQLSKSIEKKNNIKSKRRQTISIPRPTISSLKKRKSQIEMPDITKKNSNLENEQKVLHLDDKITKMSVIQDRFSLLLEEIRDLKRKSLLNMEVFYIFKSFRFLK